MCIGFLEPVLMDIMYFSHVWTQDLCARCDVGYQQLWPMGVSPDQSLLQFLLGAPCEKLVCFKKSQAYVNEQNSYLSNQRGAWQAAGQEDRTWAAGWRRRSFPRLLHQWTHQLLQEEPLLNLPSPLTLPLLAPSSNEISEFCINAWHSSDSKPRWGEWALCLSSIIHEIIVCCVRCDSIMNLWTCMKDCICLHCIF